MDLLARLGGPVVVARIADALYDRLLTDTEVGPLFAATHMPTQRERLAIYLVAACRGSDDAVPADRLRVAHHAQGVTDRHFSILAGHLADVLASVGLEPGVAADLLDLVAARRADIVTGSVVAASGEPVDPTI